MDSIRRAGVIAFLDWVRRNHPEVRSLRSLSKREFLDLATEFEHSKGLLIDPSHEVYWKWESTQWTFAHSQSDDEALKSLS